MFDGLKQKLAAAALGSVLKSLATSKNTQTTITGLIAGAVLAVPGLDLRQLLSGDPVQLAHVAAGLVVWAISVLATRTGHDGSTTFLGAVAAALQASSGQAGDITTGIVLFLVGYFTNKPTSQQIHSGGAPQ